MVSKLPVKQRLPVSTHRGFLQKAVNLKKTRALKSVVMLITLFKNNSKVCNSCHPRSFRLATGEERYEESDVVRQRALEVASFAGDAVEVLLCFVLVHLHLVGLGHFVVILHLLEGHVALGFKLSHRCE